MVHQNNVNIAYAAPGSPAGRPRISSGFVCPGAPKKRSDDEQSRRRVGRGDDYLMEYFDNQRARSPQRVQQQRARPNVIQQQQPQNNRARRQLFPVEVDFVEARVAMDFDGQPMQRRRLFVDEPRQQRQQERPAVISPDRDERASDSD